MINPYNFVRSDKPATLIPPHDHAHIGGRNGLLACRLATVTPIFTPVSAFRSPGTQANLSFFRVANRPAIPGSSLKGMIRSLAEAIANGCSPFDSRIHPRCRSVENLCPCCRLFGYLKGGSVHTGQVSISDALAEDGYEIGQRVTLKELGSPKPERHTPFYGGAGQNRERKFLVLADFVGH